MTFRIPEGLHWWAIRTKANFEKTVFAQLTNRQFEAFLPCLLYTSDAAEDLICVDLGGRRILQKKKNT